MTGVPLKLAASSEALSRYSNDTLRVREVYIVSAYAISNEASELIVHSHRYKELSLKFYTILMAHADDLQAVSVDEALIDVTSTVSQMKIIPLDGEDTLDDEPLSDHSDPAKQLAEVIRTQVRDATRCEGILPNVPECLIIALTLRS